MKLALTYDKVTGVAFIDISEATGEGKITVVDVSEVVGLRSQVLARVDENGELLGLIIEEYPAFRREVMRKYIALKVDQIIDLIFSKVKESLSSDHRRQHLLLAH